MWQDIRVAWRFLWKAPMSTTLAVITLAIAVALGAGTLGVLDETVRRPLASPAGERLVTLYNARAAAPRFQTLSNPDYLALRDGLESRLALAAFVRVFHAIDAGGRVTRRQGELVSGNYFTVLGARAARGRLLEPGDDTGAAPVLVISHGLWRDAFQATPDIVGRAIRVERREYTVVGVAAQEFQAPSYPSQFWIPLAMARQSFGGLDVLHRADVPVLQTVGVLRPGVSRASVQSLLTSWPTAGTRDGWQLAVLPGAYLRFWPAYRDTVTWFLGVFVALAACVATIACANLAGLLLARHAERSRDLAIRQALGASPLQLLRRMVSESVVLTALGGGVGVLLALAGAGMESQLALPVPVKVGLSPDQRLVAIGLGVSLIASLTFTAIFAARAFRPSLTRMMTSASAMVATRTRTQSLLVVVQIAIACVCLTGAGLLARSAMEVGRIDTGFEATGVISGLIELPGDAYDATTGSALLQRLQDDLAADLQVAAVALEWNQALGAIRSTSEFTGPRGSTLTARYNVVGPRYFETLGIPVEAGRSFDRRDRAASEPVVIVNETMAARLGGAPLDQRVTFGRERTARRIVGIVRDAKYNGLTEAAQPFAYLPLAQAYRASVWVHVRTHGADGASIIAERLAALDRGVPLSDVHTMASQLEAAQATPRLSARFSAGTAALAVFLALTGIYGQLAASVEQRRRELSIRAALGASPRDIVTQIAGSGLRLTVAGLAVGMPAAALATRLIAALLYGLSPRDPAVFLLVPAAILIVSIPAWLAPARRAAHTDPVEALKQT